MRGGHLLNGMLRQAARAAQRPCQMSYRGAMFHAHQVLRTRDVSGRLMHLRGVEITIIHPRRQV